MVTTSAIDVARAARGGRDEVSAALRRLDASAASERRRQDVIHKAAAWAAKSADAKVVGWLWENMPESSRALFDDERDFAERVNERAGIMAG